MGRMMAGPWEPLTVMAQWIVMHQRRDRVGSLLTASSLFPVNR